MTITIDIGPALAATIGAVALSMVAIEFIRMAARGK